MSFQKYKHLRLGPFLKISVFTAVFSLIFASGGIAQDEGSFLGKVRDATGAAISGASVQIRNEETI